MLLLLLLMFSGLFMDVEEGLQVALGDCRNSEKKVEEEEEEEGGSGRVPFPVFIDVW